MKNHSSRLNSNFISWPQMAVIFIFQVEGRFQVEGLKSDGNRYRNETFRKYFWICFLWFKIKLWKKLCITERCGHHDVICLCVCRTRRGEQKSWIWFHAGQHKSRKESLKLGRTTMKKDFVFGENKIEKWYLIVGYNKKKIIHSEGAQNLKKI